MQVFLGSGDGTNPGKRTRGDSGGPEPGPLLSRSLVALREALRPVSSTLARRMADAPPQEQPCLDFAGFASRHLRVIEDGATRLVKAINDELAAATDADTADETVWRAASRVEVHIEGLLDRYDEVRRVKPEIGDVHPHGLLDGVYRDLLNQVQTWLNDVRQSLDDPVGALQKRGLPTEGQVEVTVALTLEAPRQVDDLARWAQQRAAELERDRGRSWFTWVLIAFGLGWLVGDDGDE